jgi:hypothetical protein
LRFSVLTRAAGRRMVKISSCHPAPSPRWKHPMRSAATIALRATLQLLQQPSDRSRGRQLARSPRLTSRHACCCRRHARICAPTGCALQCAGLEPARRCPTPADAASTAAGRRAAASTTRTTTAVQAVSRSNITKEKLEGLSPTNWHYCNRHLATCGYLRNRCCKSGRREKQPCARRSQAQSEPRRRFKTSRTGWTRRSSSSARSTSTPTAATPRNCARSSRSSGWTGTPANSMNST